MKFYAYALAGTNTLGKNTLLVSLPNHSPLFQSTFCIFVTGYQLTDAALAHELVAANGEPGARYYVLLGRLKIQQKSFIGAEENLKQAVTLKHQVICVRGFVGVSFNTFV